MTHEYILIYDRIMGLSGVTSYIKSSISDWPVWWREQSATSRYFPAAFFIVYWAALYALGGLRSDHINIGVIVMALSYGGRDLRTLRAFLMPLILTGIIYDSQRFYEDYIRGPIHVTEPYNFDKFFFGINTEGGRLTPNEWWQLHTNWVLDLITGLCYIIFIIVFVLSCAYFRFYISRKGTFKTSASAVLKRSPAMMWSFFWVNMVGYSTYYWYAAAPPWYVAKYGLGPANLSVPASQAGCVRFDQLLGTHFFSEFYGRSADVFGAVPSLHISYPLIAAIFAFKFGTLRIFTTVFYLMMCFSAVYLNHHYILDILWGSTYAVITVTLLDRYFSATN
jgi:inositol phosphorylceramide synthase catalytic subunit